MRKFVMDAIASSQIYERRSLAIIIIRSLSSWTSVHMVVTSNWEWLLPTFYDYLVSVRYLWLHHRYYTSLRGSTGINGPNVPLRMEAIKSTALLRSYSTSPMVLALAIVLDLALPIYGVSNCVLLGCKLHPGCQGAWGRGKG